MHRTYMLCSEVGLVKNALGLLALGKHVKPGRLVYLVLCLNLSGSMHLKIYSELNTALLDICLSISAKDVVVFPQNQEKMLFWHLGHSGAVWRELSAEIFGIKPSSLVEIEELGHWWSLSSIEWKRWLDVDMYSISKGGSSRLAQTKLRGWNMGCTSVVDVCQLPPIKVDTTQLWALSNQLWSSNDASNIDDIPKICKEDLTDFA